MLLIYVFWEILKNQSPLSLLELLKILRGLFEIKFVPFQLLNILFSYLWISPSVYWQVLFVLDHRIMINSLQSGFGPTFVWTALLKVTGDHILANYNVSPISSQSPWHANATWPWLFSYTNTVLWISALNSAAYTFSCNTCLLFVG